VNSMRVRAGGGQLCGAYHRTVLQLLIAPSPPSLMDPLRILTTVLVAVVVRVGLFLFAPEQLPPVLPHVVFASMG
jgi:hypothetical protein